MSKDKATNRSVRKSAPPVNRKALLQRLVEHIAPPPRELPNLALLSDDEITERYIQWAALPDTIRYPKEEEEWITLYTFSEDTHLRVKRLVEVARRSPTHAQRRALLAMTHQTEARSFILDRMQAIAIDPEHPAHFRALVWLAERLGLCPVATAGALLPGAGPAGGPTTVHNIQHNTLVVVMDRLKAMSDGELRGELQKIERLATATVAAVAGNGGAQE